MITHLSFSQVNSYMMCPLQWHYRRAKFEPEKVSVNMVYGSAVHASLEQLYNCKLLGIKPDVELLMSAYNKVWEEQTIPIDYGKYKKDDLREIAVKSLTQYLDFMPEGEVILIEQGIKFKLIDGIPDIVGYVDLVEVRDNKLFIVDFKTACKIPNFLSVDPDQLLLYAMGFHRTEFFKTMDMKFSLEYIYLTKAKTPKIECIRCYPDKERAKRLINKISCVYEAMKSEIIYPKEGWWCSGCGYKNLCDKWEVEYGKEHTESIKTW